MSSIVKGLFDSTPRTPATKSFKRPQHLSKVRNESFGPSFSNNSQELPGTLGSIEDNSPSMIYDEETPKTILTINIPETMK